MTMTGLRWRALSPVIGNGSGAFAIASVPLTSRRSWRASEERKERRRSGHGQMHHFHTSSCLFAPKNPYEVLGLDKTAKASEIKKKYYELARKYHPDANKEPNAKERFVDIQSAYDVLSDETKRAQFDRYGTTSDQPGFDAGGFGGGNPFASRGGGGGGGGGFAAGGMNPNDIFENLFGGAFAGARQGGGFSANGSFGGGGGGGMDMRGDDIEVGLTIDFMDAAKGASKTISVQPITTCATCSGEGLKKGSSRQTCQACGGTGSRTFMIQSGFQMASTCQVCNGQGSSIPRGSACTDCDGYGKVKQNKSVKVDIPAGIEDGARIRLDRQGDAPLDGRGKGGRPGDLYVRIAVRTHSTLKRQGQNIFTEVSIPFYSAILGGTVKVNTLDGPVQVKIPPGTQVGDSVKMSGRGVVRMFNQSRGDMFVKFGITLPRSLSKDQRESLEEFVARIQGISRKRSDQGSATTASGPSPDPPSSPPPSDSSPLDSTSGSSSSSTPPKKEEGGGFFRKIHNLFHHEDDKARGGTEGTSDAESSSPGPEKR